MNCQRVCLTTSDSSLPRIMRLQFAVASFPRSQHSPSPPFKFFHTPPSPPLLLSEKFPSRARKLGAIIIRLSPHLAVFLPNSVCGHGQRMHDISFLRRQTELEDRLYFHNFRSFRTQLKLLKTLQGEFDRFAWI